MNPSRATSSQRKRSLFCESFMSEVFTFLAQPPYSCMNSPNIKAGITRLGRGRGLFMRITVVAAICLCIVGIASGADAQAAIRKQTNIPAQGLGPALQVLAKDRNLQVVYRSEVIGKLRTGGAVGELTTDEAVTELLKGTGLTFRYLGENAITIIPVGSSADAVSSPSSSTAIPSSAPNSSDQQPQEGSKSSWNRLHLAQVDQGKTSNIASLGEQGDQAAQNKSDEGKISEIVVTAQKKSERMQDVPVPVSVISAENLTETNQVRIQDYYTSVPGLNMTPEPGTGGLLVLLIRGITTGAATNPTVGIQIDDVPFGSTSAFFAAGGSVPDIDPNDLQRIEVLRGPQGTLYGASSMGGLIKFVTVDPSTDKVSGRVEAGTSSVYNGAELGYSFRGSINVPLTDSLAIRASAFTREEPGYIDNPVLHINGINESHAVGGRVAALWHASDTVSLKLSALIQDVKGDGLNDVDVPTPAYPQSLGLKDLQQSYLRGVGPWDRKAEELTATLNAKIGIFDLTSATGYSEYSEHDELDGTTLFGFATEPLYGLANSVGYESQRTSRLSEEFRLSATLGSRADWLLGAFYTHENTPNGFENYTANEPSGAVAGPLVYILSPFKYQESALFSDLTFHFTDHFDVQIGGRGSRIQETTDQTYIGPYDEFAFQQPSPIVYTPGTATQHAVTYLLTPSYKVSPDLMLYARLASGYRPGGPNLNAGLGTPPTFKPDKTINYEIGAKGGWFDHKLTVDGSLYYIDWKDVQVLLINPVTFFPFDDNVATARSRGIELSIEARPLTGLLLSSWVSWDDAVLTADFPASAAVYAGTGNRLPFVPRFSGNVTARQEFPLSAALRGYVGAALAYVGDRQDEFNSGPPFPPPRQDLPAYAKVDLQSGVTFDSWNVNIFANNVLDRRGLLGGGLATYPPYAFTYIQPRTVGLNVVKKF